MESAGLSERWKFSLICECLEGADRLTDDLLTGRSARPEDAVEMQSARG